MNSGAKLALGGAQLGMDYGRTNLRGRPPFDEAVELVRAAVASGVTTFDTARSYGSSEAVLGAAKEKSGAEIRIVTKLAPARDGTSTEVDASVRRSLYETGTQTLDVVLLHRATELTAYDGRTWMRLCELQEKGLVKSLGVSVQTPVELEAALLRPEVEVVQIPLNVLDRRWDTWVDGRELLRVEVHARSVFLQGVLLSSTCDMWPVISESKARAVMHALDALALEFGRCSRADLCVAYVRSFPCIDYFVIGVDGCDQLDEATRLAESVTLTDDQVAQIRATFASLPLALLDPSKWNMV